MRSQTGRAFRSKATYSICLAVIFALSVLPRLGNANVFIDNPDCSLDRQSNPQFNAIGLLSSPNLVVRPDGLRGKEESTAFLVAPCYIFASAHALLGDEASPQPGTDYTRKFSAGIDGKYAFAGSTIATPALWGNNSGSMENDWVLMRLKTCIGQRKEFGWFDTPIWENIKSTKTLKFVKKGVTKSLFIEISEREGYADISGLRSENGIWFARAIKDGQVVSINLDELGRFTETRLAHSLSGSDIALVAFWGSRASGNLRISYGTAWEKSLPFERVAISASATHGTSGGPIFAAIDGHLQVVGILQGNEGAMSISTETVPTYLPGLGNVFFPIQRALRRPDVAAILEADRSTVSENPNRSRMDAGLPKRTELKSCWH